MKRKSDFKIDDTKLNNKRIGNTIEDDPINIKSQNINNINTSNTNQFQKIPKNIESNIFPQEKFNFSRLLRQNMKDSKTRIVNINQNQNSEDLKTGQRTKRNNNEEQMSHIAIDTNKLINKINENFGNKFNQFNYFDKDEVQTEPSEKIKKSQIINPNITLQKIDTEPWNNNNTQTQKQIQIKLSNPQSVITFKGETSIDKFSNSKMFQSSNTSTSNLLNPMQIKLSLSNSSSNLLSTKEKYNFF